MPFVLGPDLDSAVAQASEIGFDAFELFPPKIELIDPAQITTLCKQHSIAISTIGTGGGAVSQGLTLTDPSPEIRDKAKSYVRNIIQIAGDLGASAIIGSMQGRANDRAQSEVLSMFGDALAELGEHAKKWNQPLIYEPLNRYETDLANTLTDASKVIKDAAADNCVLLADLFHMNIEESNMVASLKEHSASIGHVHFVDSNRWSMGSGHSDGAAIVKALKEVEYQGFLAVEAFPLPSQSDAAQNAMKTFEKLGLSS